MFVGLGLRVYIYPNIFTSTTSGPPKVKKEQFVLQLPDEAPCTQFLDMLALHVSVRFRAVVDLESPPPSNEPPTQLIVKSV